MKPQDLSERQLYKFTGPPENWLTAIKFMTWGLEQKYLSRWKQIEPGDIFLMHSTSTNTLVKGAPSSVIGFGVVSSEFRRKDSPLWLQEIERHENIWPLLVPFSEIYLFSEIRPPEALASPTGSNNEIIIEEAKELLADAARLPIGFPQMGSFSSVKPDIIVKILEEVGRFYLYRSQESSGENYVKPAILKEVSKPEDILRKPVSLENLDVVKKKTIKLGSANFVKDMQTLERAETAHHETLSKLLNLLKSRGYTTYSNKHVDLFALRGNESHLFEVKSFNQKNFRSQSRKGIVQLFEYEYFEIRKFFEDKNENLVPSKSLIYSQSPTDTNYISFINNLKMSAGYFTGDKLEASGQPLALLSLVK